MRSAYVATDVRLFQDHEGIFWSTHPSVSAESISIYLNRFDSVYLLARMTDRDPGRTHKVSAPRIYVVELSNNDSRAGLLRSGLSMVRCLRKLDISRSDVVVTRVPEFVSFVAWATTLQRRSLRLTFVVAEPAGVSRMIFGRRSTGLSERVLTSAARAIVASSHGTIYVTSRHLQNAVPPRKNHPTLARSNVRIRPDRIALVPRSPKPTPNPFRVLAAGSMTDSSKGFDLLVASAAALHRSGTLIELTILGDGPERELLRHQAQLAGIAAHVSLPGFVSDPQDLLSAMTSADLFVMPSRTEGLPRVLIEAMSQGTPAIGTRVGGIPELISEDGLFDPTAQSLIEILRKATSDPKFMATLSAAGLATARRLVEATSQSTFDAFLDALSRPSRHPHD